MLSNLRKKLSILCGIATSTILTLMVLFGLSNSFSLSEQNNNELFNKNIDNIIDKIRTSNMISHDWLNNIEADNHLIIYLENLGHPLSYTGYIQPITDRNILIEEVKKRALSQGMNLESNPISSNVKKSSVFTLDQKDGEYYRGMEIIIPSNNSWTSAVIIQWIPNRTANMIEQGVIFLFIDLMGCIMMFILSYIFIGKAMKPVEENQQRQVEFIAAASHELRSPLTIIKAGVSSLKDDIAQANSYLPHIESECNRMTRLINDMLLLATSDAKTWVLNKELIDMDTFLIETYDLFCPLASANNQILFLDLPEEPLYNIQADKERLKQILTILIDNAMEYTPENKQITIHACNNEKFVLIEIIDEGFGISDEQKKLIFNRFYRGDKSRTSKKHFGLGLNIAKELIELHKGKLYVKDTTGGGATFVLEFLLNCDDSVNIF